MDIRIKLEDAREGYTERDITVSPTVAHVNRNESVRWILEGKDTQSFVIFFQGETPVGQVEVHGRPAGTGEPSRSEPLALKNAVPRSYRYAVAVSTSKAVFLDAACPELILR